MKPVIYACLFSAACSHFSVFAATEFDDGGDGISCKNPAGESTLSFLDFVVAPSYQDVHLLEDSTTVFSQVAQAVKRLGECRPPSCQGETLQFAQQFWASYESSLRQLKSGQADYGAPMVWRPGSVTPISDESIEEAIPRECLNPAGKPDLIQLLSQRRNGSQQVVRYDAMLLSPILESPLQKSMMVTHELLWRFGDSARAVRASNVYLHSQEAQSAPGWQIEERLRAEGLDFGPPRLLMVDFDLVVQGEALVPLQSGSPVEVFDLDLDSRSPTCAALANRTEFSVTLLPNRDDAGTSGTSLGSQQTFLFCPLSGKLPVVFDLMSADGSKVGKLKFRRKGPQ